MRFAKSLLIFLVVAMTNACTTSKVHQTIDETPVRSQEPEFRSLTYQEFRAKQKSYDSSDGSIKYIDQGRGDAVSYTHLTLPTIYSV